jgi:hypothetical protein
LGLGAALTAVQYVVTHSQPSHNPVNLDFLLDPLSKSEFLSFYTEKANWLKMKQAVKLQYLQQPASDLGRSLFCPSDFQENLYLLSFLAIFSAFSTASSIK